MGFLEKSVVKLIVTPVGSHLINRKMFTQRFFEERVIGRCRVTSRKSKSTPGGKSRNKAPALRSRDIYQLCGASSVPSPSSVLEDIALCNGTPGGELTCVQLQQSCIFVILEKA
jgi:hypothetical protein